MKRQITKTLSILLATALAFAMTVRAGTSAPSITPLDRITPPDRGRFVMPFGLSPETGERVLSFGDELETGGDDIDTQSGNKPQAVGRGKSDRSWLLQPGIFEQLSSGGQRAVLLMNGRLPARGAHRQSGVQQSEVSPEANPGDNIRVNNPALDTDFHTHSETSVAVNGSNIIVSFNEFDFDGYGVSSDGGNTFTHKRVPDPPNGLNAGDGVVAFGPNGEAYYSTLVDVFNTDGTVKSLIGAAKSTDKGITFSAPVDASTTAGNTTDLQDKEWIAVDRNANSPNKGNVYVTWTDFTQSNGRFIEFARSTDNGTSFSAPLAVSPQDKSSSVQGSVPVVAPDGTLYVAFYDTHTAIRGIGIVKSTDGGKTFSNETKVATFNTALTMTGCGGVRTNSFPSVAVDPTGAVHVVYAAFPPPFVDRGDVFYTHSTDGGTTFSPPLKLNDDGTTTTQYLPSIAALSDGTLGVKWWDRRNDPVNDSLTDVYMAISHDGGMTFGKNFRITSQNWFFSPIEPGFASGYHGDYDDIAANGSSFALCWSDERSGLADAYFTVIPEMRDPTTPDLNISAKNLFDNVLPGNSAKFDMSTSGVNGFSGPLSLNASPAIPGLVYSFASATVNAGDSASLTVATTGAQPGNYLITVSATGGALARSTNVRLTVSDPNRLGAVPTNATRTRGFTNMQGGIKVDSGGMVHLVYDDDTANPNEDSVFYTQSPDAGKSFSAPMKISGAQLLALQSSLALDSAGNPDIVWTGFNATPSGSNFPIFFSKSTDHGGTFSSPLVATPTARTAENAQMAIDKNGNVAITYVDFGMQGSPLFAVRSTDGGATFSTPVQVSQTGDVLGNPPFIAVDPSGAAYVIYQDSSKSVSMTKLAIASDGQHFAAPNVISNSLVNAFAPQIAIDNNGAVYATWYDRFVGSTAFNREIVVAKSTDKGATFGTLVNVSNNSGQSTFPSLILGNPGVVSVAWEDTTGTSQLDVFVARSTDGGLTWGPPINLSNSFARAFGPFGSSDPSGNLFIGWTGDPSANTDAFVTSLSPSALGPPDFALGGGSAIATVQRGTRAQFSVNVNRVAGFSGNVTVTVPDLSSIKIKQPGGAVQSTTGASVTFTLKLKGGGPTGSLFLPITGQDDSGRTRTCYIDFIVQPAAQ